MKKDHTTTKKDGNAQLADLLQQVQKLDRDIDETIQKSKASRETFDATITATTQQVRDLYANLDAEEKNAGNAIDNLLLQHAEDMASK